MISRGKGLERWIELVTKHQARKKMEAGRKASAVGSASCKRMPGVDAGLCSRSLLCQLSGGNKDVLGETDIFCRLVISMGLFTRLNSPTKGTDRLLSRTH